MEKINFNHLENQHRCLPRQTCQSQPPYIYRHVPLTFFIESRNYGWGTYQGILYNLNIEWQAEQLLNILLNQGFISYDQETYTIHDLQYTGFERLRKYQLLYYLGVIKLTPLTPEECISIDTIIQRNQSIKGCK